MANRYYKEINGRKVRVPGVTTVCGQIGWGKDALMAWANRAGLDGLTLQEARHTACSVGTRVHDLVEASILGTDPPLCDWLTEDEQAQADAAFGAWLEWRGVAELEFVHTELEVVSRDWDVGGRIDAVVRIGGRLAVFDWKSSARVYPATLVQVAAYAAIYNETADERITECHVVRLDKLTGEPSHYSWTLADLVPALRSFEVALLLRASERALSALIAP